MAGTEILGMIVGAGLTILVFSYLLGDNPLYRLALHLFIGALIGYTLGLIFREVGVRLIIAPWLEDPLGNVVLILPVMIGLGLFFFKSFRRIAYVGNLFLAYLIGVGLAIALRGAWAGTFAPQVSATAHAVSFESLSLTSLVRGVLIVVGTASTLLAFNFSFTAGKRAGLAGLWARLMKPAQWAGRTFLTFAFGVAFAGALTASLVVFIGRIQYLIDALSKIANAVGM